VRVCAGLFRISAVHADLYIGGSLTCLLRSWAFGRLSADLPRLDAWNSRGTAPAQPNSIGAARIPGVSPFMQTLAYRTRGFLSNRFRCVRQLAARLNGPAQLLRIASHMLSVGIVLRSGQPALTPPELSRLVCGYALLGDGSAEVASLLDAVAGTVVRRIKVCLRARIWFVCIVCFLLLRCR